MVTSRAVRSSYRDRLRACIARSNSRYRSCQFGKSLTGVIGEVLQERDGARGEGDFMLEESQVLQEAHKMIDVRQRLEADPDTMYRKAFHRALRPAARKQAPKRKSHSQEQKDAEADASQDEESMLFMLDLSQQPWLKSLIWKQQFDSCDKSAKKLVEEEAVVQKQLRKSGSQNKNLGSRSDSSPKALFSDARPDRSENGSPSSVRMTRMDSPPKPLEAMRLIPRDGSPSSADGRRLVSANRMDSSPMRLIARADSPARVESPKLESPKQPSRRSPTSASTLNARDAKSPECMSTLSTAESAHERRPSQCPSQSELRELDAFYDIDDWREAYQNDEIAVREDVLRTANPSLFPFRDSSRCSTAESRQPLTTLNMQSSSSTSNLNMRPSSSASHLRNPKVQTGIRPSSSASHLRNSSNVQSGMRPSSSASHARNASKVQTGIRPSSSSSLLARSSSKAQMRMLQGQRIRNSQHPEPELDRQSAVFPDRPTESAFPERTSDSTTDRIDSIESAKSAKGYAKNTEHMRCATASRDRNSLWAILGKA